MIINKMIGVISQMAIVRKLVFIYVLFYLSLISFWKYYTAIIVIFGVDKK